MNFISFVQYVFLSLCFILIPAWFLIFVTVYILEIKKVLHNSLLIPLTLLFTQLGLWHFYFNGNRLYEGDLYFMGLALANIAVIAGVFTNKSKYKLHLYLIPFVLEFAWILSYLYH